MNIEKKYKIQVILLSLFLLTQLLSTTFPICAEIPIDSPTHSANTGKGSTEIDRTQDPVENPESSESIQQEANINVDKVDNGHTSNNAGDEGITAIDLLIISLSMILLDLNIAIIITGRV